MEKSFNKKVTLNFTNLLNSKLSRIILLERTPKHRASFSKSKHRQRKKNLNGLVLAEPVILPTTNANTEHSELLNRNSKRLNRNHHINRCNMKMEQFLISNWYENQSTYFKDWYNVIS